MLFSDIFLTFEPHPPGTTPVWADSFQDVIVAPCATAMVLWPTSFGHPAGSKDPTTAQIHAVRCACHMINSLIQKVVLTVRVQTATLRCFCYQRLHERNRFKRCILYPLLEGHLVALDREVEHMKERLWPRTHQARPRKGGMPSRDAKRLQT